MNHTYRVVYHQATNTYIAVSETTTHKHQASSKAVVATAAVAALGLTQQAYAVVTVSSAHSQGVITSGVSATSMEVVAVPSLAEKQRIAINQQKPAINFNTLYAAKSAETSVAAVSGSLKTENQQPKSTASAVVADDEVINTVRVAVPANDDVNVKTTAATAAASNLPKEPTASKRAGGGVSDDVTDDSDKQAVNTANVKTAVSRKVAFARSYSASAASAAVPSAGPSAQTTTGVNVNVNGSNVALEAGSTLNVVNGQGTVVSVDNSTASPTLKINTPLSYADESGNKTETATNAVSMVGANSNKAVTIHNVEAGVANNDAVNVKQLRHAQQQLNQKLEDVADDAKAGTAAALAAAGLAQAYMPGKNMVSISGSTYRGQQGYAVGFSTITDSGNWVFKGAATGHSQGYFGATIGAGYQW